MLRARMGWIVAASLLAGTLAAGCGGSGDSAESGPSSPRPADAQADDPVLGDGRAVYIANCARCHGVAGDGAIGPKLADGRAEQRFPNIEDQITVVRSGRGAMPSFAGDLNDEEIRAVVRYEREVL